MTEIGVTLFELKANEIANYEPMYVLCYNTLIKKYWVEYSTDSRAIFNKMKKDDNLDHIFFFAFTEPRRKGEYYDI